MKSGVLEQNWLKSETLEADGIAHGLTRELLSLYWNTANSTFLIVYRPAFMRDFARNGPYFSKSLLNAMCFSASRHANPQLCRNYNTNVIDLRTRFQSRFKESLRDIIDHSTITAIQALLVMSSALAGVGEERNAAWIYSGIAFRMIFDLGLRKCEFGIDLMHWRNPPKPSWSARRMIKSHIKTTSHNGIGANLMKLLLTNSRSH